MDGKGGEISRFWFFHVPDSPFHLIAVVMDLVGAVGVDWAINYSAYCGCL